MKNIDSRTARAMLDRRERFITERKRAEENLKKIQRRLADIVAPATPAESDISHLAKLADRLDEALKQLLGVRV